MCQRVELNVVGMTKGSQQMTSHDNSFKMAKVEDFAPTCHGTTRENVAGWDLALSPESSLLCSEVAQQHS